MRNEFAESYEHLRSAVGHAAGGAADLVGPRVGAAKRSTGSGLRTANRATAAAVLPVARAARVGARASARQAAQAANAARKGALVGKAKLMREEPPVKRWPMMLGGLLVAGAAVGAASAFVARRRANRGQWEEYGTPRGSGRTDSMVESTRSGVKSTVESGKEKVQSLAESAKERAADLMGTSSTSTPATSDPATPGSREDIYGKTGSASHNSR
jgi:hypothetical protein